MSGTRQPRYRVSLNGATETGCYSLSTDSNNNFSADTFSAEFATNRSGAKSLAWWSNTDTVLVNIEMTEDVTAGGYVPVFAGEVDDIDADPIKGTVSVTGRDLSRRLRDARTQETFLNQTSSQVAATLAARRGLTAVGPATKTLVSRFYSEDHDHITGDSFTKTTNEWDLLVYLAQHEGFDVFVQGTELHFQPSVDLTNNPFKACVFPDGSGDTNVIDPRLHRALTLAKDIEVDVRSWSPDSKSGFTVKAAGKMSGKDKGGAQRTVIMRPNLTHDQAQKLANSTREDLSKRERLFDFEVPGNTALTPRTPVLLSDTGTSWDGPYYISSIERRIDVQQGFHMAVKCKNHSPANETIPG